jgi:amino acid adenylation domain-containing protein
VRFGEEELSYAELDRRANRLALRLRELGVRPDVVVGVHLERSAELLVGLLAVLKAGGAYLPLEPGLPVERLRTMARASSVPVVLVGPGLGGVLDVDGCVELSVDGETADCGPEPGIVPGNLAYVIYTSGSTGVPKGVQITHAGIVNRLLWMQEAHGLTDRDRVLHKTPISFDVSVWELFWPLISGACVVVAAPRRHRDPAYLAELMGSAAVTVCHFVPVMLKAFLDALDVERFDALRLVVCSGEELPAEVARQCLRRLGVRLENLYGPTEAAVDVTSWTCGPQDASASVPIGAPIANTQAYVLDPALNPAPLGVPGELYLAGAGLARGYGGRAGLTAERFVAAPFGPPGSRMYRTGDRARWTPGGRLEFLGRLDQQVKIRGYRIEPGEIEQTLLRHPSVAQAQVLVREDQPGDRRLIGYIATSPGAAAPSPAQLQSLVGAVLPKYMVPSAIVVLDAFPLTASGKIDKKALAATAVEREAPSRAPATTAERDLAALWEEVLGLRELGADDDLFKLGADSMHVIAVVGRARQRGFAISVEDVFRTPTVAALAARRSGDAPAETPHDDASDIGDAFLLLSEEDRARLRKA